LQPVAISGERAAPKTREDKPIRCRGLRPVASFRVAGAESARGQDLLDLVEVASQELNVYGCNVLLDPGALRVPGIGTT
jgi:hypothetical protein